MRELDVGSLRMSQNISFNIFGLLAWLLKSCLVQEVNKDKKRTVKNK